MLAHEADDSKLTAESEGALRSFRHNRNSMVFLSCSWFIEKEFTEEASISASNVWRVELAKKALVECMSEAEIIIFLVI